MTGVQTCALPIFPFLTCPTYTPDAESCESVPAGICGYTWEQDAKLINQLTRQLRDELGERALEAALDRLEDR